MQIAAQNPNYFDEATPLPSWRATLTNPTRKF